MSYQAGNLTSHGNFLDVLVAFLTSTDCNWELLNDTDNTACTAADVADIGTAANVNLGRVVYLKSFGLDYAKSIYYCFWEVSNAVQGYYNIGVRCSTSYSAILKKENQTGVSPPHFICMTNAGSTPYWFVANQQRVMCFVSSLGGTYRDSLYAGFITPAISDPGEVPLPYAVGGSAKTQTAKFDDIADRRAFWNGITASGAIATAGVITSNGTHTLSARAVGGQWLQFGNGDGETNHNMTTTRTEPYLTIAQSTSFMPDSVYNSSPIQKVPRAVELWCSIYGYQGCYGELDGIFYVGGEGLNPQDLISIDGVDYLVWNNINQATRNMFCAIRLA
jgi:hypothetical protein